MTNKLRIKVEPTENEREWILLEDIEYEGITVPKGFVTDGASIPNLLRFRFPHGGKKFFGACVHDWLYRNGIGTHKEADKIFFKAMCDNGVPRWDAKLMYCGVFLFGGLSWAKRKAVIL